MLTDCSVGAEKSHRPGCATMRGMEPNAPRRLNLGDTLNGTIVKSIGGRRFAVKCKGVPDGWKVELHTRRPELIRPGAPATFWVAKVSPLQGAVLVHDGDFGRLPISDAMRERYISAMRALLAPGDISGDEVSDARAMVLRIEKKDQADWLSVWHVLGDPASGDVKQLLAAITAVRDARKTNPEALPNRRQELVDKYGAMLNSAINRLL